MSSSPATENRIAQHGSMMIDCKLHGPYEAGRPGCPGCKEDLARSRRALESGIPVRHWLRTLENFRCETDAQRQVLKLCRQYVEQFPDRDDEGAGLVFCGPPGTGKTHLAAAMLHAVMDRYQVGVHYVTAADFFGALRSSYSRDAEADFESVLAAFRRPDLVAVDEIGVQHGTEFERNALYRLIDTRYQDFSPTLIISNLTRQELVQAAGQRVVDRMDEAGATVVCNWDSYRPRAGQDPALPKGRESAKAYDEACKRALKARERDSWPEYMWDAM